MATITIPTEGRGGNPVRVMINGVEYIVPRGVETTVSDAVAAELAKLDMALIGGSGYAVNGQNLGSVDFPLCGVRDIDLVYIKGVADVEEFNDVVGSGTDLLKG